MVYLVLYKFVLCRIYSSQFWGEQEKYECCWLFCNQCQVGCSKGFLEARCTSCCLSNSIKALKAVQSTDTSPGNYPLASSFHDPPAES